MMRRVMPPSFMISPSRMKSGIASRSKTSSEPKITWGKFSSKRKLPEAMMKVKVAPSSTKAMGMPSSMNSRKAASVMGHSSSLGRLKTVRERSGRRAIRWKREVAQKIGTIR